MKRFLPATALFALMASGSAMAAELTIPMSFEYLAVDGKPIATNSFKHLSDIDLSNGTHKIAIRYSDMIEDDFSDSQTFVKSKPFIITLAVDGDYQYKLEPATGSIKQPKQFAKAPQVKITRADNGQVNYKIMQTNIEEQGFMSKLFGTDNAQTASTIAVSTSAGVSAAAAVAKAEKKEMDPITAATSESSAQAQQAPTQSAEHAQQMLQYWWLQADEQTRKEFMSWAIKQL